MENARLLVFETYCRIHQCIDLQMLADKLGMDKQAAETWVVNLIRNARLNAKIDSKVLVRLPIAVHVLLLVCAAPAQALYIQPCAAVALGFNVEATRRLNQCVSLCRRAQWSWAPASRRPMRRWSTRPRACRCVSCTGLMSCMFCMTPCAAVMVR